MILFYYLCRATILKWNTQKPTNFPYNLNGRRFTLKQQFFLCKLYRTQQICYKLSVCLERSSYNKFVLNIICYMRLLFSSDDISVTKILTDYELIWYFRAIPANVAWCYWWKFLWKNKINAIKWQFAYKMKRGTQIY